MSSQGPPEAVLSAATRLLERTGKDFTMEQLAAESGLSRATLYRQVRSKTEVLAQLGSEATEDVRARILRAAHTVFSAHGLLGGSMEQVAQTAGVGVATVYRHFGDKDALVRAVVDHIAPRTLLRRLSLSPTDDLRADLERLTRTALGGVYELRGLLRLSVFGSEAERAYLERVRHGTDRTAGMFERYFATQMEAGRLRRLGQPKELALAFSGLLFAFGVLEPLRSGSRLEEPDRTADLIVGIFLDGLRAKGGERDDF